MKRIVSIDVRWSWFRLQVIKLRHPMQPTITLGHGSFSNAALEPSALLLGLCGECTTMGRIK